MVNRKAFFDIFFYNRENPSRELLEMAERVWRAYMVKYGLGLDAGAAVEPTYEEVREITYMANYAADMVASGMAAEEEKPSGAYEEAVNQESSEEAAEEETAEEETAEAVTEEAAIEEAEDDTDVEAAQEAAGEEAEAVMEEAAEEAAGEEEPEAAGEETAEAAAAVEESIVPEKAETAEAVAEVPAPRLPEKEKAAVKLQAPEKPVRIAEASCDLDLWVEQVNRWCRNKGLLCIQTVDGGDVYLHVYLPHKKAVHPVGTWCFAENTGGAGLAAEMTKLYAYCTGFADCFEKLIK